MQLLRMPGGELHLLLMMPLAVEHASDLLSTLLQFLLHLLFHLLPLLPLSISEVINLLSILNEQLMAHMFSEFTCSNITRSHDIAHLPLHLQCLAQMKDMDAVTMLLPERISAPLMVGHELGLGRESTPREGGSRHVCKWLQTGTISKESPVLHIPHIPPYAVRTPHPGMTDDQYIHFGFD